MRLHTKRGIRLGLAVGIELFLGFVLVAPFGGVPACHCLWQSVHQCFQRVHQKRLMVQVSCLL